MKANVGTIDRVLRVVAGLVLIGRYSVLNCTLVNCTALLRFLLYRAAL